MVKEPNKLICNRINTRINNLNIAITNFIISGTDCILYPTSMPPPVHGEVYSIQHYVMKFVSPGTPVSLTNKTDCQDITEILLKVALNTIYPSNAPSQPMVPFLSVNNS